MSYRDFRLHPNQLQGVANCPHCGVAAPVLQSVWGTSQNQIPRADGNQPSHWRVYACTTCGHLVSAKGQPGERANNPLVDQIYPDVWEVDEIVPERVKKYLAQAHKTLAAPDASVVMSASSIDAMLKDNGLTKGSLYNRIDEAVKKGLLTQKMADWAHRVRLDANNPRHADETTPHMSSEDARRAFDFANTLTEYLYILPSRMPPEAP